MRVSERVLHYVRSEVVQQGAEGQPVPPGGGEVGDLHPTVVLGDFATPNQQRLAGVGLPSQHRARDGAGLQAGKDGERESERERGLCVCVLRYSEWMWMIWIRRDRGNDGGGRRKKKVFEFLFPFQTDAVIKKVLTCR